MKVGSGHGIGLAVLGCLLAGSALAQTTAPARAKPKAVARPAPVTMVCWPAPAVQAARPRYRLLGEESLMSPGALRWRDWSAADDFSLDWASTRPSLLAPPPANRATAGTTMVCEYR